jgi:hypothetical protein
MGRSPYCVDALDHCRPLSVALLNALWPSPTLRACNSCSSQYHAHHKARLIKAVSVFILDATLCLCGLYQLGVASDSLRIFARGSLIAVLSVKLDFELRVALDTVGSPFLANWVFVTLSKQRISHLFYCSERGRKSPRVQVKDMLDNCLLFCRRSFVDLGL